MANIARVRTALTGFPGGPGVMTVFALDAASAETVVLALQDFWPTFLLRMPVGLKVKVENQGDVINDVNGEITGAWTSTATTELSASAGGVYAAPVGLAITWTTATILHGKRLKGRSYIVPMSQNIYAADGSVETANLAACVAAAQTFHLACASKLVVWHRPRLARPADGSRPEVTAREGGHGVVVQSSIRDKIAILTSRRD